MNAHINGDFAVALRDAEQEVAGLRRACIEHDRLADEHRVLGKPRAEWRIDESQRDRAAFTAAVNTLKRLREVK